MQSFDIIFELDTLASDLIRSLGATGEGIREGIVMTVGPAPYRRIDCDGRALAYVRTRPRKRVVRVDISGLWLARRPSRLLIPAAGGSATLTLRSRRDVPEAVEYLREAVARTRAFNRRMRQGGVQPQQQPDLGADAALLADAGFDAPTPLPRSDSTSTAA